jgi:stage III sporulation protein SpoIIIAA
VQSTLAEVRGASVEVIDNLDELLAVLPAAWVESLTEMADLGDLLEIVCDVGRPPEARFAGVTRTLSTRAVGSADIEAVTARLGEFSGDNRAGIERTLHRISALRNRRGALVGLTCRVGRAVYGTVEPLRELIESGRSVLLVGRPGVGKTTLLREAARVLADELGKRVMVVDTSNEIGGDGDIPHPGIGRARRIQVPAPELQHAVMIEAVENHMPEVVVIDEIGTEAEALAARTIAERGVQLIATAHGNTLANLIANPTLSDLVGGVQAVTLGDDEARRRRTRKTVLERKAPPTFEVVIEINQKDRYSVHAEVGTVVDRILRGFPVEPETRVRRDDGSVEIETPKLSDPRSNRAEGDESPAAQERTVAIYPYAISRQRVVQAVATLRVPAVVVDDIESAGLILTSRAVARKHGRRLRGLASTRVRVYEASSNSPAKIEAALRRVFSADIGDVDQSAALREAESAVIDVISQDKTANLAPRPARVRRLQHELATAYGLESESVGREPFRRVLIQPRRRR